jgi:hypothetical protein
MRRILLVIAVAALMTTMLAVAAGPALANGPTTKDACKEAKPFIKDDPTGFFDPLKNPTQGQCIQFVKQF